MKLIEGIIDGIICVVTIALALFLIIIAVRVMTMMYHSNDVPRYPTDTPAPKLEMRYGKEDSAYLDNDTNDDPGNWRYMQN